MLLEENQTFLYWNVFRNDQNSSEIKEDVLQPVGENKLCFHSCDRSVSSIWRFIDGIQNAHKTAFALIELRNHTSPLSVSVVCLRYSTFTCFAFIAL